MSLWLLRRNASPPTIRMASWCLTVKLRPPNNKRKSQERFGKRSSPCSTSSSRGDRNCRTTRKRASPGRRRWEKLQASTSNTQGSSKYQFDRQEQELVQLEFGT